MSDLEKIKFLIADTTAFINNVNLSEYAENILTIPDVITEVKNRRQIRRLVVLPFDLIVREPSLESQRIVTEFAKKTGDYASLSGIDMKVIALTYELEKENVGIDHVRLEPIVAKTFATKEKPEVFDDNVKIAGFYTPSSSNKNENFVDADNLSKETTSSNDDSGNVENIVGELNSLTEIVSKDAVTQECDDITDEDLEKCFDNLNCDDTADNILLPDCEDNILVADCEDNQSCEEIDEEEVALDSGDEDKADEDIFTWITPKNMKKVKKQLEGKSEDDIIPTVGCMSTDFAIQNVLKQMNLNICALNGRVIKHIRTYILRCYTCFKTTSIITKVFCPVCGHKTLKKVAVSLDESGQQVIHINTRRPLTKKYKNQSLPRFKGGKHSTNPILFEDQPMPKQMPSRVAKTKTNALDEDYVAGYSPFVMRDTDSKSALLRQKGNIKQLSRNNTYEENRRKRNANRLIK